MTEPRIWTEELTFKRSFSLKTVGELPAGTYQVEFEEHDIVLHGHTKKQIMRCEITIPQSMLRFDIDGLSVKVDHRELRLRHKNDTLL